MKKFLGYSVRWLLIVGLLVIGCKNSPEEEVAPSGVTDEESAMKYSIENDEFVKNDELLFGDQEIAATDYVSLSGRIEAAIHPLRWGRFIAGVTPELIITIQPGDTIAKAYLLKNITGTLRIRAIRGVDTVLVEKPFNNVSARIVMFRRVNRIPQYWRNWIPVATSSVAGGTPSALITIESITMVSSTDSIAIIDPLNYYLRYQWLRALYGRDLFDRHRDVAEFTAGDSVRVRVKLRSSIADTDLVALRFGSSSQFKNRAQMRLTSQYINGSWYQKTYEKTFFVHNRPGQFHAAVETGTKGTFYSDLPTAYSVSWWAVPYRVF